MPRYKITRIYIVPASSKTEATEKVKAQPIEYLEFESCKEASQNSGNGLVREAVRQITGK